MVISKNHLVQTFLGNSLLLTLGLESREPNPGSSILGLAGYVLASRQCYVLHWNDAISEEEKRQSVFLNDPVNTEKYCNL